MAQEKPNGAYGAFDKRNYTDHSDSGDGTGLFGAIGDFFNGVWNDITGASAQTREFEQQEYLQDKMNEYNLPSAQMAREAAAGINRNTAAAGIAGSGNESAQAPAVNTNVTGMQGALGALSGIADSVFGGIKNVAEANEAEANATRTSNLWPSEQNYLRMQTYESFCRAGVERETAFGLAMENYYKPHFLVADLATKYKNLDLMQSMIDLYDQQFFTEMKKLDVMNSEIELNKSAAGLNEMQRQVEVIKGQKMALERDRLQWHMDFLKQSNIDLTLPSGSWFAGILFGNGTLADKKSKLSSLLQTMWINDYVTSRANSMGALRAKFAELEKNKEFQQDLIKYGITANGFKDLIWKYGLGTGFDVKVGPFGLSNDKP